MRIRLKIKTMRIRYITLFVNIITLPKDLDFQENRSASSQALEDDRRGSEETAAVLENVVSQQNIVADNTTPVKPRRPDYREVRYGIKIIKIKNFHFRPFFKDFFVAKIPFFELKLLADPGFHPN